MALNLFPFQGITGNAKELQLRLWFKSFPPILPRKVSGQQYMCKGLRI